MKLSQPIPPFQPVTLILETQEEVDQLTDYLSKNTTQHTAGLFINKLFGAMQKYRCKSGYFNTSSFVE